jgi:hypothetical protein
VTAPLARTVGWPSSPKVLVHAIAGEFGCYASTRAIGLMIDRAVVEVPPHEVPYADPTVTQFSMVLVTTSRRFESRR